MGWADVARATFHARREDRWVAVSAFAALAVASLFVLFVIFTQGRAGQSGAGLISGARSIVALAVPLLALLAAAGDPPDMPTEAPAARIVGTLAGTLAATLAPALAVFGTMLFLALLIAGQLADGFLPLLSLLAAVLLLAAAWASVSIAATARSPTTGRALAYAFGAYAFLTWVMPSVVFILASLLTTGSAFAASPWNAFLLYLSPGDLAERLVGITLGPLDFGSRAYAEAIGWAYSPGAFVLGLSAWILVPLGIAISRVAPASRPPQPPAPAPPAQ